MRSFSLLRRVVPGVYPRDMKKALLVVLYVAIAGLVLLVGNAALLLTWGPAGASTLRDTVSTLLAAAVLLGFYGLPTIIAWRRHVPGLGGIALYNFVGGLILWGWLRALDRATAPRREEPHELAAPPRR